MLVILKYDTFVDLQDTELIELRHTIELLRKQSIEAGLTVASMTAGMVSVTNGLCRYPSISAHLDC